MGRPRKVRGDGQRSGPETKTYRVRGIPCDLDIVGTRDLLASSLQSKLSNVKVDSLATGTNGRQGQVATVRLLDTSEALRSESNEWRVPAASHLGAEEFLVFDTHFLGFTPLYTPALSEGSSFE